MTTAALSLADTGVDRLTFDHDQGFHAELKRRVNAYFREKGLAQRGNGRMYLKTAMLLVWFAGSYSLLVFAAVTFWQGAALSLSLALAMAGIGFGIQHDANHGAYSNRPGVNRLMGMMLDVLGASSYLWKVKHNLSHHTFTNVVGGDDDINFLPFARLSPSQPHYRLHRFQHFYLWLLYWFLYPKWNFVDDFKNLIQGSIAGHTVQRPRRLALAEFIGGKVVFLSWAFLVPLCFHPWWVVLFFYATTALLLGTTLAVVFMLAHCVEEADFPRRPVATEPLPHSWAVHQVQTTVNFAPSNRLLTWYAGGLNFQIEHHLFPRICHIHYPRIAPIVREVCDEFGVRYGSHASGFSALASHWRWLRRMGGSDARQSAG
jgi:linoleoyl-CoA desaturase